MQEDQSSSLACTCSMLISDFLNFVSVKIVMSVVSFTELNIHLRFSKLFFAEPLIPPQFNVLNLIVDIPSLFTPVDLQVADQWSLALGKKVLWK